jgi:protein transport protein SEC24
MKFTNELYCCLTRAHAWESVFRVRTSAGFNQISTLGNILIKQKTADLVICPTIDKDRVFCYEIERADESTIPVDRRQLIKGQTHLYIQSALLYSTAEGERRIRVHNACIPLTNIRHLPFDYIDPTAIAFYYARSSLARLSLNSFNF